MAIAPIMERQNRQVKTLIIMRGESLGVGAEREKDLCGKRREELEKARFYEDLQVCHTGYNADPCALSARIDIALGQLFWPNWTQQSMRWSSRSKKRG